MSDCDDIDFITQKTYLMVMMLLVLIKLKSSCEMSDMSHGNDKVVFFTSLNKGLFLTFGIKIREINET